MKNLILLCSLSIFSGAALAQSLNVVSTYPADGAFAVETDSIVITFDKKVNFDPSSTEDSVFSFFISPEDSVEKIGANLSADSLSVIFYGTLNPNTDYVAMIEYAEGISGEVLQYPYLFQFTTASSVGQFTVEGSLEIDILAKTAGENPIIVFLTDKPFQIGFGDDGDCYDEQCPDTDPRLLYAALADPVTGTYFINGVREGSYYPTALGLVFSDSYEEFTFPEVYFYDPDENYQADDIQVNLTTAPSYTISEIRLSKLKLRTITFSEALEIAQDVITTLGNTPVIVGGNTSYAYFFNPESNNVPKLKSKVLQRFSAQLQQKEKVLLEDNLTLFDIVSTPNGYQIEWSIFGYDAVKDSAFEIVSNPFGAEFIQYIGSNDAELPEGISFTSIKELPTEYIDSDSAASIIENEGGLEFRELFGIQSGYWSMDLQLLHNYWEFEPNPSPTAPVMWRAEYNGYIYNPITQAAIYGQLVLILDSRTGEVLYTDSDIDNGSENLDITFKDALELADSVINALPNSPLIIGGYTNYSSDDINFKRNTSFHSNYSQAESIKAKESSPSKMNPDGQALRWEIYGYDSVKDSLFIIVVNESEIVLDGYVGEGDIEEIINFSDINALPNNYIDSDSAAHLIDVEGGLAFRNKLSDSDLSWYWDMDLEILHQFWNYPPNPTPTAPITWLGKYYASAYDDVTNEYIEDSLFVYLDAVSGDVLYSSVVVANEYETIIPYKFRLLQNYPNPFNPTTNIVFELSGASRVEISIYSILGQKIATIVDQKYSPGIHSVTWDAKNLSSGMYIYQMNAAGFTQTKKLILLK